MSGGSGSGIGSLLTGGLDRSGLSGSGSTLGLLTGGISDVVNPQSPTSSGARSVTGHSFITADQRKRVQAKLAEPGDHIDEASRNEFLARASVLDQAADTAGTVAALQNLLTEIEQVSSGTAADPKYRDRKKLAEQRKLQKERPGRRGLLGI